MVGPNYLTAADNHNIVGSGTSWYNPASWDIRFGNVGRLAATSVLSGYNSLYNTAATVGNWLGADIAERDTQRYISALDSDLGQYYRYNQESADLIGFVGTALIPGFGGIKAFNLGQSALKTAINTGQIGGNMSKGLGILIPNTERYVSLAAKEMNSSVAAGKLLNANTTKALASGVWQNTLEAAAAETVIQATMFRSPILDNQDVGDILTNIAIGGAFGGVVGGAFSAAKIRGQLKTAQAIETAERAPFTTRPGFVTAMSPDEKIISLAYDSEATAFPKQFTAADGSIVSNNYAVNKQLYDTKVAKNYNEIRTNIQGMSDDPILGNMVANMSTPITGEFGYAQKYLENFLGSVAITRASHTTKVELTALKQLAKNEVPDVLPDSRYLKLVGENAGRVIDQEPILLSLGDRHAGREAVRSAVKGYGFKLKDSWDAATLTGQKGYLEAEARYIWASDFLDKIPEGQLINANDIPLLERAYADGNLSIKITKGEGPDLEVIIPQTKQQLYELIKTQKVNLANDLLERFSLKGDVPVEQGTAFAAKIVNTKQAYLEGFPSVNEIDDLFANQADYAEYLKGLSDRGLSTDLTKAGEAINPWYLPKYAKVVYDTKRGDTSQHVADAIVGFKENQAIFEQDAKNVVAKILGPISESLPDIRDTALVNADRVGGGPGLVSAENSNYGTIGSMMAWIGSITRGAKEAARSLLGKNLEGALVRLAGKQEAAIEFEGINQKVTRSGKLWVHYSEDGFDYLVDKKAYATLVSEDDAVARTIADLGEDELIAITNRETRDAVLTHIGESGKRTNSYSEIRAAQGLESRHDPMVFRPIRPDLKQYPHFAFVTDPRVTGSGHVTMIHAASEKELAALIDRVPPQYRVRTKAETEEFYKARSEYEYSRTLNENYINSDLANNGVFSNFFPKSDPTKIVDDILQQHYRESDVLIQETVRLRYEAIFNQLEDMGKRTSLADTSRFASRSEIIEKTTDNPYFNYIKTALDISKAPENRLVYGFNKLLDESVSRAVGSIRNTFFNQVKTAEDLEKINAQLDEFGIRPAYYDASLQALANHSAPRGELTKFVRRANSLLSLFTLGLDPLNALNNAIGSNILRMTELKHLTKAIAQGNGKIAGELADIAKVALPGSGDEIFAPTKLVARAIANYWKDDGTLAALYKSEGIIKSRDDQLRLLVDDFTLKGTESVSDLNDKIGTALGRTKEFLQKGERLTLNAQAEEFNRFISANVMDQISEVGIRNGVMTPAEAKAYRNTFVNRVEGNILASQRPLIFQGPIGQAISLFQSYQFNLLQQLFRYVAEGSKKDLAMLAGLQSTLYGIQSLPAFQFVNTHIIGQLSGNKEHRDAYDAVYGIAGKTAGNFFLYGLPSNFLQTNIYSRGDINPRHLTILPTSLQEIPIVGGWGKFILNAKDTFSKIGGGANVWESILQGIEHNGISRPLAGLAQTLQGVPSGTVYSTSNQGSILYSNDLFHLATLSRLAGGRPIDEAVTNDALFRVKAYESARRSQMSSLAEKVKTTLISGSEGTPAQVEAFAARYAELGGKQGNFNRWMMSLYKSANVPQSETLANSLRSPFSYKMQLLMGGDDEE